MREPNRLEGKESKEMPDKRKLSYDLIRIAAIAMVVMIHVSPIWSPILRRPEA